MEVSPERQQQQQLEDRHSLATTAQVHPTSGHMFLSDFSTSSVDFKLQGHRVELEPPLASSDILLHTSNSR